MNGSWRLPEHIPNPAKRKRAAALKRGAKASGPIVLDLNENPFGPSPLALKAVEERLAGMNRYPDIGVADLTGEIARFHGVTPAQVLVTAGVTELLGMIAKALLAPGFNAVTSACSFLVYRLATELTPGRLIEVEMREHGYDLQAIQRSIDRNTRIVFVANPNNPTGSLAAADALAEFVARLPQHVLLVLDEAYGEFAEYFAKKRGIEHSCSLDYVREKRNIIVLKTFSKAHGLAGLRVGYGIAPEAVISRLRPLRTIFSVSALAQAAAGAALHDRKHVARCLRNNAEQAGVLTAGLERLGLKVLPTWTNFLYCETGQKASVFSDRLSDHGITVQPLEAWGADEAVRVTIGTPEENRNFLEAVAEIRKPTGAR